MVVAWTGIDLMLEACRVLLFSPTTAGRVGADLVLAGAASSILISQHQMLRHFHAELEPGSHEAVWEVVEEGDAGSSLGRLR